MKKPLTDYDQVRAVWYEKLRQDGFVDIEQDENNLRVWSTEFTKSKFLNNWREKEEYYYIATTFLNDYSFETELDRVIWEYHTNAISVRNIADTLNKTGIVQTDRNEIQRTITRLRTIMMQTAWSGHEDNG